MHWSSRGGFSLIELILVASVMVVLMAIAIPQFIVNDRVRVNNAAREVREALQTARLRSVAVNRALQVRFNCPATGQYRIVEAGTWSEGGRCDPAVYPYPAPADAAYLTPPKPRFDGPLQRVHDHVALNSAEPGLVVQFSPDGRAMKVVSGVTEAISSSVTLPVTVSANGYQKTITINGLGKVLTQ